MCNHRTQIIQQELERTQEQTFETGKWITPSTTRAFSLDNREAHNLGLTARIRTVFRQDNVQTALQEILATPAPGERLSMKRCLAQNYLAFFHGRGHNRNLFYTKIKIIDLACKFLILDALRHNGPNADGEFPHIGYEENFDAPLDMHTLRPFALNGAGFGLPNDPRMGSIQDDATYLRIQNSLRETSGGNTLLLEILLWNSTVFWLPYETFFQPPD